MKALINAIKSAFLREQVVFEGWQVDSSHWMTS